MGWQAGRLCCAPEMARAASESSRQAAVRQSTVSWQTVCAAFRGRGARSRPRQQSAAQDAKRTLEAFVSLSNILFTSCASIGFGGSLRTSAGQLVCKHET